LANSVFSLRNVDAYYDDSHVLPKMLLALCDVIVESTRAEVIADARTREVYLGE
jgi:hypothetical protein